MAVFILNLEYLLPSMCFEICFMVPKNLWHYEETTLWMEIVGAEKCTVTRNSGSFVCLEFWMHPTIFLEMTSGRSLWHNGYHYHDHTIRVTPQYHIFISVLIISIFTILTNIWWWLQRVEVMVTTTWGEWTTLLLLRTTGQPGDIFENSSKQ